MILTTKKFFSYLSPCAPSSGRPHNNWLYRTRLDHRVGYEPMLWQLYFLYRIRFLNSFFFKNYSVQFLKLRFYYYTFSKRRKAAYCRYLVKYCILKNNTIIIPKSINKYFCNFCLSIIKSTKFKIV